MVIAYLWSTILADQGLLNSLLGNLGLAALQQSWLGTARGAQLSVMVVSSWPAIDFSTVVFQWGQLRGRSAVVRARATDDDQNRRSQVVATIPALESCIQRNCAY